ncbi:MAG: PhoX family protein, partial [Actinomycetota bacterium]
GHVRDSWGSLRGTQMNCSGGPMPWGTWVTCEETVNGPDVFDDFTRGGEAPVTTYEQNKRLTQPHGYLFEVPANGEASAEPVRAAGRFAHEAIAYSPDEGVFYLTEDDFGFPSGFYRYEPPTDPARSRRLEDGGQLSMLAVVGAPNAHLEGTHPAGTRFDVKWVRIEDPDPAFARQADGTPTKTNDDAIHAVAEQGWALGAAFFGRNEGAVFDRGTVFFTSTQGGGEAEDWSIGEPSVPGGFGNGRGQIWAYHTREQVLELVYESPSREVLDFPDNVTTSERGTLVVCEDGGEGNWLRGLSRDGRLFDIARNVIGGHGNDEFAGSTFSPDGRTLYVNIQSSAGLSMAIWGPWHRIGV